MHLGPLHRPLQDCHLLWFDFQQTIHRQFHDATLVSTTPSRRMVWAIPISLAATDGIEVSLFSCGYLDVSVPRVRFDGLCIQPPMTAEAAGFPHSEILGSKLGYQLP